MLWRDSWDKDEVADCAKSYMTQLVMDGANKILVSKVLYYQSPSYQPTYMEDSEPFRTLAHLANMTTFELLPNDVLAHLRKAVQVIIITKGFFFSSTVSQMFVCLIPTVAHPVKK